MPVKRWAFFLVFVLVLTCQASVNINGSAVLDGVCCGVIAGHFPMTVGGWVYPNALRSDGDGLVIAGAFGGGVGSGWLFHLNDIFNCGTGVLDFVKGGSTDHFVCSTITAPPVGSWTFLAAVITSTQVHFFSMTTSRVVTTQTVSDTTSFTGSGNSPAVGSSVHVTTPVFITNSELEGVFVYGNNALTDTELQALAFGGMAAVTETATAYWPLCTLVTPPQPDTSGNGYNLSTNSGTPLNSGLNVPGTACAPYVSVRHKGQIL
jgi:hypothetical protein